MAIIPLLKCKEERDRRINQEEQFSDQVNCFKEAEAAFRWWCGANFNARKSTTAPLEYTQKWYSQICEHSQTPSQTFKKLPPDRQMSFFYFSRYWYKRVFMETQMKSELLCTRKKTSIIRYQYQAYACVAGKKWCCEAARPI